MRAAALLGGAMALAGAVPPPVPPPVARPLRVMSMNLCTDQILLALLPPARIASVSRLARDPNLSLMAASAARVALNRGTSEEVIAGRPDLVLAGTYTTTATRQVLRRFGWPLVEIAPADTVPQIRANVRTIAAAVGARARGEALIARMDADLARLARDPGPRIRVAAWDGGGFDAGRGTLYDGMLRAAGAVNVAADAPPGAPDPERLLAAAPALLVRGGPSDADGLRGDAAYHPVIRRIWGPERTIRLRPAYYICGTPFVADGVAALRAQLRARAAIARRPLPFAGRWR